MAKLLTVIAIVVFLVVGMNVYLRSSQNDSEEMTMSQLSQRLLLLEEQLQEEKEKREELELVIGQLNSSERNNFSEGFSGNDFGGVDELEEISEAVAESKEEVAESREARREAYLQRMQARNDPSRRISRLEEAGFASDQADWIVRKEKEVQFNNLNDRWERQHQAYLQDPEKFDLVADNPIRAELGDQDYEKYLAANGRATSVRVNQVLDNSPAAYAGLQAGDEILRYSGQRVFNFSELNKVTVQGEKGSSVVVDVMRNGSVVQLTVERGPIGISSRRGRRGF
ncbi:MAG: PDZ domain-containing protein [Cellvibrionaceae bacterium]